MQFLDPKNDADLQDYTLEQESIDRERRQQEGSYQEGINKGAQEEKEAVAINFLKMGITSAMVAQGTDLTLEQIEALRKKMNLKK